MKLLIQRVHNATITIDHDEQRSIDQGLVVYVGLSVNAIENSEEKITKAVNRLLNIGMFTDENGRIKKSLTDIQGGLLIVSNFTLHGRNKKGNQLDFTQSAPYQQAETLYNSLINTLQDQYDPQLVKTGKFGAYMQIDCSIDGPVNIVIDL